MIGELILTEFLVVLEQTAIVIRNLYAVAVDMCQGKFSEFSPSETDRSSAVRSAVHGRVRQPKHNQSDIVSRGETTVLSIHQAS